MWTFLASVLEQRGALVTLFFLMMFSLALRTLWNQNQSLRKQLKQQAEEKKDEIDG